MGYRDGISWHSKVKEGVEVRFMYDGTCMYHLLLPYNYPEKSAESLGIQCKVFNLSIRHCLRLRITGITGKLW